MEIGEVQDIRFQEREWRAQRVGWVLLLLFVGASVAGVFGPGPLSLSSSVSQGGSLQAEYYSFTRLGGEGTVTVTVASREARDGNVAVWWNSAYLDEMKVNGVTPQPDTVTFGDGGVRYEFAAQPGEDLEITYDLTPDGVWSKRAEIAVGDERVSYHQFVYP